MIEQKYMTNIKTSFFVVERLFYLSADPIIFYNFLLFILTQINFLKNPWAKSC